MHFFLQGESGAGKSYLLRQALEPYRTKLAGFGVQRIFQNGALAGFRAVNIREEFACLDRHIEKGAAPRLGQDGIFRWGRAADLSVLEEVLRAAVEDSARPDCRIVLLDEIGGAELESERFMELLYGLLSGGRPCVGVLKSAGNLARMLRHTEQAEGQRLFCRHQALVRAIEQTGALLTMTEENRAESKKRLEEYLEALEAMRR